jgi:S-DNA-T family DNA segregation ATPase FtsK/SpoIIIE
MWPERKTEGDTDMEYHKTPGGCISTLYLEMASQSHLLIAGRTGSGKSVVINGIIHAQLCSHTSGDCQLILVDPKRVELAQWRKTPHCLYYASEPAENVQALKLAIEQIEKRYSIMQRNRERKYNGGHIYVIIDELADLMTTQKKSVLPLLQRIAQIGRAANVHLIAATQCPTAQVLSTQLKCNFDAILGLKTRCAQDSRNIVGCIGCEQLPQYGKGYYVRPGKESIEDLPMIPETDLKALETYWGNRKNYLVHRWTA